MGPDERAMLNPKVSMQLVPVLNPAIVPVHSLICHNVCKYGYVG